MSLILEALKKLERDKQVDDRGFLVMAARPWPSVAGDRLLLVSGALAAFGVAGLLVVGIWWWRQSGAATHPVAPRTAAAVAAAPPFGAARMAADAPPPNLPAGASLRSAGPANRSATSRTMARERASMPPVPVAEPPARVDSAATAPPAAPAVMVPAAAASGGVHLTATSKRDGRPVAIINDRLMFEGDAFDGIKVLHIGDNEVDVEVRGERRTLRF